ncbi:fatty acid elongase [Thamnocephalis sphaerospora]|uniref:Elongation of fatty acids protein n=1 Tax=Thamnocephalis sphaerospora TaxID=78915 RepID=A0A4P9XWD5_9FUNG|nr:fatty acid elongase [Thamnocephalis sphaerospora]|eukprot:RKP10636.1 fatty acid elongase [Thamnocephalis sphaerospora]
MSNATAAFEATRPFGLSLYNTLAPVYQAVVGAHPDTFRFVVGKTPLSTVTEVAAVAVGYLVVIFGIQAIMRNRAPIAFPTLARMHNLLLSVGSAVLLLLHLEQVISMIAVKGLGWSLCDTEAWTQRLELLYYINYLFKYYELIDTLLLAFKKKPLEFLHYFHHSQTMILCYIQIIYHVTVSWFPIVINLGVHVIMYYYFYLASMGVRVWWKKYITTMQISQFVLDIIVVYSCVYNYYAERLSILPYMRSCNGSGGFGGVFAAALLTIYLGLFAKMYRDTYVRGTRKRESTTKTTKRE